MKFTQEGLVQFLAYLNQLVRGSISIDGRFHPHPMYIFMNLVVPVILGVLLAGSIKIVHWILAPRDKRNN